MKRLNKKGVSRLILILLILLFVVIAVAIVWIVVKTIINNSSEQITLKGLTTGLKISLIK